MDYVQQITALDFIVSRPMCVSLGFLGSANWAHCQIGSMLPSSRLRSRWTLLCVVRMSFFVLPHVPPSRRRERDTLGELLSAFNEFFWASA